MQNISHTLFCGKITWYYRKDSAETEKGTLVIRLSGKQLFLKSRQILIFSKVEYIIKTVTLEVEEFHHGTSS